MHNHRNLQTCACGLAVLMLAACGNQSPPATAANGNGNNPPTAAANPNNPAPANGGASNSTSNPPQQQNLSVDDLLGKPAAQPTGTAPQEANSSGTANPAPAPPAQPASASTQPANDDPALSQQSRDMEEDGGAAEYARVVSVKKLAGPRQVCTDERVVERRHPGDHTTGTVVGAVVGGVLGNRIGRGGGRTLATVGGAVAGGAVGREIGREHDRRDTVTRVVRHCRPATNAQEGADLYEVIYAYQGQNLHARLDYDPGERIRLPVRSVE